MYICSRNNIPAVVIMFPACIIVAVSPPSHLASYGPAALFRSFIRLGLDPRRVRYVQSLPEFFASFFC